MLCGRYLVLPVNFEMTIISIIIYYGGVTSKALIWPYHYLQNIRPKKDSIIVVYIVYNILWNMMHRGST